MRYILLFATIFALAAGQVLFKIAATGQDKWTFLIAPSFLSALILYAGATLLWIFTLRLWPITAVYPATALSIVLVMVAGIVLFGERPNTQQWVGVGIIVTGLLVLIGS